MTSKVLHILAWFSAVVTLTMFGLVGAMLVTGKLTGENLTLIANVLRGEPLGESAEQQVEEAQPELAATADQQVSLNENALELATRRLDRREQELLAQRIKIDDLLRQLEAEKKRLDAAKGVFAEQVLQARQQQQNQAFQEQLKLYTAMAPKLVKDDLMGMADAGAARYLRAMKPRLAADVIAKFQSAAEKDRIRKVMTLMREAS